MGYSCWRQIDTQGCICSPPFISLLKKSSVLVQPVLHPIKEILDSQLSLYFMHEVLLVYLIYVMVPKVVS